MCCAYTGRTHSRPHLLTHKCPCEYIKVHLLFAQTAIFQRPFIYRKVVYFISDWWIIKVVEMQQLFVIECCDGRAQFVFVIYRTEWVNACAHAQFSSVSFSFVELRSIGDHIICTNKFIWTEDITLCNICMVVQFNVSLQFFFCLYFVLLLLLRWWFERVCECVFHVCIFCTIHLLFIQFDRNELGATYWNLIPNDDL